MQVDGEIIRRKRANSEKMAELRAQQRQKNMKDTDC